MKISELFSDQSKWTKHHYATDRFGQPVRARDLDACHWCLVGALICCYGGAAAREAEERLYDVLKRRQAVDLGDPEWRNTGTLAAWNDASARKFEEVRALVEEAGV
jgi:hypothetical protein